jgi:folate-dependent phosphoribosylglycinamide formyltransferase PurN
MKIGLLTSTGLSEFRQKSLAPILADNNLEVEVAIVDVRPKKTLKQKIRKHLKRGRGGYIIIMALQSFLSKATKSISIYDYCQANDIDIIETKSLYSEDTIAKVKAYHLDVLLLIGGYGIIKKQILEITPQGVLSYHHGDMRKYRGMPPALWELYNNEKEMGVTVQILSPGLDSGIPIVEKSIPIKKNDSVGSLHKRASNESIDMMYRALLKLLDKTFVPETIETFGKIYTLPNLKQWLRLQIRIFYKIICKKSRCQKQL